MSPAAAEISRPPMPMYASPAAATSTISPPTNSSASWPAVSIPSNLGPKHRRHQCASGSERLALQGHRLELEEDVVGLVEAAVVGGIGRELRTGQQVGPARPRVAPRRSRPPSRPAAPPARFALRIAKAGHGHRADAGGRPGLDPGSGCGERRMAGGLSRWPRQDQGSKRCEELGRRARSAAPVAPCR